MSSLPPCPKCQQPMHQGFVIDRGDDHISTAARWAPGVPYPRKIFFWSFPGPTSEQVQRSIEIITIRCTSCGYLESYAPNPPAKT